MVIKMSDDKFLREKIEETKKNLQFLESVESEEDYFRKRSDEVIEKRREQMKAAKNQAFDTIAL